MRIFQLNETQKFYVGMGRVGLPLPGPKSGVITVILHPNLNVSIFQSLILKPICNNLIKINLIKTKNQTNNEKSKI